MLARGGEPVAGVAADLGHLGEGRRQGGDHFVPAPLVELHRHPGQVAVGAGVEGVFGDRPVGAGDHPLQRDPRELAAVRRVHLLEFGVVDEDAGQAAVDVLDRAAAGDRFDHLEAAFFLQLAEMVGGERERLLVAVVVLLRDQPFLDELARAARAFVEDFEDPDAERVLEGVADRLAAFPPLALRLLPSPDPFDCSTS